MASSFSRFSRRVAERYRAATPRGFNRTCQVVSLLALLAMVPSIVPLHPPMRRGFFRDFSHFYMGGLIARLGMWDQLYPKPYPDARFQASMQGASELPPRYAELARKRGVRFTFAFGQTPPNAVFYAPFGYFPYYRSHKLWLLMSALFAWGVAIQAGRVFSRCAGTETRGAGVVTLLVALAPNTFKSISIGQVSTAMSFLVGVTILGMIRPRARGWGVAGPLAMAVCMIGKYATGVLLPLAAAMRQWRMIFATGACFALIILLTLPITGLTPWRQFTRDIAPTLDRSHPWRQNQSLHAFLIRARWDHPTDPLEGGPDWRLPPWMTRTVNVTGLVVLAVILGLIFTRRQSDWLDPPRVFAAAALLIVWLSVFSPIYWDHYLYLYPLWGWLAWEATGSKRRLALVVAVLLLAGIPWATLPFRVPFELAVWSHHLWSTPLVAGLAVARLLGREHGVAVQPYGVIVNPKASLA